MLAPASYDTTMSTSDRLDRALAKLKEEGHLIGAKGTASKTPTGGTLILVDGQLRPEIEILEMAGCPDVP
jgi:hypothetical protein